MTAGTGPSALDVKGGAMSGEVEFKISDKALVGVLKQHNNRTNRLR